MKAAADAILQPEQATYLASLLPARDPLLQRMEALAAERREPISDPEVAAFLGLVTRTSGAKYIVELGTNIGYGAIVLARAAGPAARVVTIEFNAELCERARGFIGEAGLGGQIEVRQGAALAELAKISTPIDLAYVDCVKEEYSQYLELLVPRLSPRGIILADNVLWRGLVARSQVPEAERRRVDALRAFNAALSSHRELDSIVLPFGDGVAYAVKKGS